MMVRGFASRRRGAGWLQPATVRRPLLTLSFTTPACCCCCFAGKKKISPGLDGICLGVKQDTASTRPMCAMRRRMRGRDLEASCCGGLFFLSYFASTCTIMWFALRGATTIGSAMVCLELYNNNDNTVWETEEATGGRRRGTGIGVTAWGKRTRVIDSPALDASVSMETAPNSSPPPRFCHALFLCMLLCGSHVYSLSLDWLDYQLTLARFRSSGRSLFSPARAAADGTVALAGAGPWAEVFITP